MTTFLFVIDVVIAAIYGLKLTKTKTADASRGTNCVTRFMRDVGANRTYTQCITVCGGTTILMFIIGTFKGCFWVCLPTLIPIGVSVYFKVMSNRNAQRVKDARVVTKGTGKVIAATGDAAATTTAFVGSGGNLAAAKAAHVVASSACKVLDKAMDQMDDVESIDVKQSDFTELNGYTKNITGIDIEHPEEFIEAATRAGISTEGKDLREVAYRVIECAPTTALEQLPDNMSTEEKAMRIMKGAMVCEEDVV